MPFSTPFRGASCNLHIVAKSRHFFVTQRQEWLPYEIVGAISLGSLLRTHEPTRHPRHEGGEARPLEALFVDAEPAAVLPQADVDQARDVDVGAELLRAVHGEIVVLLAV